MADYLPERTGFWTTTTWITAVASLTAFAGAPPMSADDVWADGKTIVIDTDINVATLRTTTAPRTGGTFGGGFRAVNGRTYRANLLPGSSTVLTFVSASPNFFNLVGNLSGFPSVWTGAALAHTGTGTINITGTMFGSPVDVTQATGTTTNVTSNGGGTINMVGDIRGGSSSGRQVAGWYASTLTLSNNSRLNLIGNVIGFTALTNQFNGQTSQVLLVSRGIANIVGNVIAYPITVTSSSQFPISMANNLLNTVSITGNVVGGANQVPAIYIADNAAGSSLTITGNVSGGNIAGAANNAGILFEGGTYITNINLVINGNVVGGSTGAGIALTVPGRTGTVTVNGNVIGGSGAVGMNFDSSTSSNYPVVINGTVEGRSAVGFNNNQIFNAVYIKRAKGGPGGPLNPNGGTAAGLSNTQNGLAYAEEIAFGDQGATPVSGPVFLVNRTNTVLVMEGPPPTFTSTTLFGNLNVPNLFPPVSSVRLGITYGNGDFTGTMIVPPAQAVQVGVPVDNTVGTFVLSPESFWTIKRANSAFNDPTTIGYRIKNLATIASVGQLIGSFNLSPPQSAFNIL